MTTLIVAIQKMNRLIAIGDRMNPIHVIAVVSMHEFKRKIRAPNIWVCKSAMEIKNKQIQIWASRESTHFWRLLKVRYRMPNEVPLFLTAAKRVQLLVYERCRGSKLNTTDLSNALCTVYAHLYHSCTTETKRQTQIININVAYSHVSLLRTCLRSSYVHLIYFILTFFYLLLCHGISQRFIWSWLYISDLKNIKSKLIATE